MSVLNTPLVSIIIPCYNVSAYVEKAINSILSQSYDNLEIWIIDDASTDDTLRKIEEFKDDRIHIVPFKENTQKVGAVNEVLKKVTGEFIAFQDADDWSEQDRIMLQVKEFEKDSKLGVCFTNYRYVGEKTFLPHKIAFNNTELKKEFHDFTYKRAAESSPTNCPSMMISKSALFETKGYSPHFKGRVAEDIQWIYRILKSFRGITIDKVLYNYSIRKESFSDIQSSGLRPKYAYSWQLLAKIIRKDIYEGIDVLAPENKNLFAALELEACEDALMENIHLVRKTIDLYNKSANFRLGKLILTPWRTVRRILKKNRQPCDF